MSADYRLLNPAPGCIVTFDANDHKQAAIAAGKCYKPAPQKQCPNGYYYIGVDEAKIGGGPVTVIAAARHRIIMAEMDKNTIANPKAGYGNQVRGQLDDGSIFIYAHLASYLTEVGKIVEAGEPIGVMGMTGNATDIHLHGELRINGVPVDWWPWVIQDGQAPPVLPPPPAPISQAMPLVRVRWKLRSDWEYLTIRSAPRQNSQALGRMKPNEEFDGVAQFASSDGYIWNMAADGTWRAMWHSGNQYLVVARQ